MIVESQDVRVCFTDPDGETQCFDALKVEFDLIRTPEHDIAPIDFSPRSVSYTLEAQAVNMPELLHVVFGYTRRKATRIAKRHARRARHLAYQTSRKTRRHR